MIKFNKEFITGSFILSIAFNIFSVFNLFYQIIMARFLTAAEYGILAALLSVVNITVLFSDSIQTILAKYSAKEKDKGKIKNLFKKTFKKALIIASILFMIFLLIALILSRLWNISYLILAFTGIILFSSILAPVGRGIMQGKKRFASLGINLVSESGLRIIFSLIFILIGLTIFGAIGAVIISALVGLFLSIYQIRDITKTKEKPAHFPAIYQQSILIFIFTLAVTIFYNLDIIIAKIIFIPEIAGYYAIASILGKIVFWGTQPISKALLPVISSSKNEKKEPKQVFYNSLILLTLLIAVILITFYILPNTIIGLFSGKVIVQSSSILLKVGCAMALIAYANLILFYKIAKTKESKNKIREDIKYLALKALIFFLLLCIEAFLLYTSSGNLETFSNRLIWSAVIFLIGSFIVYKVRK